MAALIYLVWRHNFLQIGRQKNLIYAVSATFLALLYLSFVRRLSGWLEPVVPPEASASILLFVLVIFIEPLQRTLGRRMQESAHREMDRVQRLSAEIQQEAKQGDVAALVKLIERRTREEFELAATTVTLADRSGESSSSSPSPQLLPATGPGSANRFRIGAGEQFAGVLAVKPYGAFLSGETAAAIEFLCERLPGAIDLCLLIEEKLHLERELAERERLAVLGQMAASISHNLKNPLGSIKTILQLQLENPEVPESIRGETRMVLQEVRRLSEKLNQLLQFSRPTVRGGAIESECDAQQVAEEIVALLRHEAEERGIAVSLEIARDNFTVYASAEALGEVVSNLVVNALEAASRGGRVEVNLAIKGHDCVISVEDDGPGIPPALQEKILQPFFTTKSKGTGLGLAIVARRVAEFRGTLKFVSPVRDTKGTRFEVTLLSPVMR
jgi:signal transduction histidine kinase